MAGGAPWLDGLVMEHLPSGNVLRITFPHIYFARWFAPHKADFSAAVKAAWPNADAPGWNMSCPGSPCPRARHRKWPRHASRTPSFFHADGSRGRMPLPGGARNAFPWYGKGRLREPGTAPSCSTAKKARARAICCSTWPRPSPGRACASSWPRRPAFFSTVLWRNGRPPVLATGRGPVPGRYPDPGRTAPFPAPAGGPSGASPRKKAPVVLALEGGPDALGRGNPARRQRPATVLRRTDPAGHGSPHALPAAMLPGERPGPAREHLRLMARRAAHFHGLRSLLLRVKSAWEDDAARHPSLDDLERLARTGPVQACHAGHEQILAEAARCCDAAPADITGTGRHARLVMARQAAMYVCRRHLGLSYPELGRAFGGRDHSTVIHAVKKDWKKCWKVTKMCNTLSPDWRNAHIRNSRTAPPRTKCSGRRRAVLKGIVKISSKNSLLHMFRTKAQASIITRILL